MTATQTQKLNAKNKKAVAKLKADEAKTAELHEQVRQGEKTAAEALQEKAGPTETEKLQKKNAKANRSKKISVEQAKTVLEAAGVPNPDPQPGGAILTVEPAAPAKPKTLAEAFPPEPASAADPAKPKLIPTGDPTVTTVVEDHKQNGEAKADKPKKTKAQKEAKRLRKDQKKGTRLWVTPESKEVVSVVWQKMNQSSIYERWLVKYSDGTEEYCAFLSVVYSRENPDHHLVVGAANHYNKLSNKDFADVLQKSRDYLESQRKRYDQSLKNFLSSDAAQGEMEKKLTKKVEKAEPLTDEEQALAKLIAQLANKLEGNPNNFVMLPKKLEKLGKKPELFDLSKYGIDERLVTIRLIQEAIKIFRTMEPSLGGESLSKAKEKKTEAAKEEKPAKQPKPPKEPKPQAERDAFGTKVGTQAADINACITNKAQTVEQIAKCCKLPAGRCKSHLKWLAAHKFVTETNKGWILASKSTTTNSKGKKDVKADKKRLDRKPAVKGASVDQKKVRKAKGTKRRA